MYGVALGRAGKWYREVTVHKIPKPTPAPTFCFSPEGARGALAILDTLHQALVGCELLQRNPSVPASAAPAHANPFLISC